MKYTKRSRKENIRRTLKWYIREKRISDLEISLGMPELHYVVEGVDELDADDLLRAFDWLDIDVVCIPRGDSKANNWFCLTEMPYDDGGKNRGLTIRGQRNKRKGSRGDKGIPKTDK